MLFSELLSTLSVGFEAGRRVLVFTDEKQAQHYYRTASDFSEDFATAVTAATRCEHGSRPTIVWIVESRHKRTRAAGRMRQTRKLISETTARLTTSKGGRDLSREGWLRHEA